MNRREFLKRCLESCAAAGMVGLLPAPPKAFAATERKFLFLFASGGWDPTYVFEPKFGTDAVDMDPMATLGQVGGITFTAGERWPSVSRFFERWASETVIVNGIDSHSVGHDSCTQFMLTGTSASTIPDWPTILASRGQRDYPMPHVVYSGPNYAGNSGSTVVRGGGGTLLELIDGSLNGQADRPTPRLANPSDHIVDAFVYERTRRYAANRVGKGRARVDALLDALDQATELEGRSFEANLSQQGGGSLYERARSALDVMRLGLARCAMIGIGMSWDTHGFNAPQGDNFETVFSNLDRILDYLASTPGDLSPRLLDEVVLVVMSEMGRTPLLNGNAGKDHWPYTSMLIAGSGVAGGRVLGATDEGMVAVPVDFKTGQAASSGTMLGCEHVGAALLALGGLDPQDYLAEVQTFEAILRS